MSHKKDPALSKSNFERHEGDRYWTEPNVSGALVRRIATTFKGDKLRAVLDPCAGRGDLIRVLKDAGHACFAADIDPREFPKGLCPIEQCDFLTGTPTYFLEESIGLLITNPPFGDDAEECIRKAHAYMMDGTIQGMAFLLRSEWNHGKTRLDLFQGENCHYRKEIVLTWRPRWDWWMTPEEKRAAKIAAGIDPDKPDSSPRHNFSWFCWDRSWTGPGTTDFATRIN